MNNTQQEKIVSLMIRRRGQQEWFLPQDFMKPELNHLFVGYEASARLSELAKEYPFIIESRREGKYMARRFRFENYDEIWEKTGPEWHEIFQNEGFWKVMGVSAKVDKNLPPNTIKMFDIPPKQDTYF